MPSALRPNARWEKLGELRIPALLVHPDWDRVALRPPVILWMHGRTASKEIDPGRYLRWMRAGIGACAIDLPGHGERLDPALQDGSRTLDVVKQLVDEIDEVIAALQRMNAFDTQRIGVGGSSAGGMAALVRLCRPHGFACASVEATSGSWEHQVAKGRQMFRQVALETVNATNPIQHLDGWREIPFQALHAKLDEWVAVDGQAAFIEALRQRYVDQSKVEFVVYDRTGAPHEHIGFGLKAADAKDRQRDFFRRWLTETERK